MRDPTTILLAKDQAPETNESFYAKIKVSASVNFEVGRLKKKKKMMKKIFKKEVWQYSVRHYIHVFYVL